MVGRIVTPAGEVGPEFQISPDNGIGQLRVPAVTSDGTNFYAAWSEQTLIPDPVNQYFFFVYGRGIDGTGGLLGTQAAITPLTDTWNHSFLEKPAIVWDGTSHYVAAWTDQRAGASNPNIWARRVTQAFVRESAELQLTSDTSAQTHPTLARSGTGLLAAFIDARSGTAVYGQLLTSGASLALSGPNFSIGSIGGATSNPTVSAASDGTNYAVVYSNSLVPGVFGSFTDQVYAAGVTAVGGVLFAAERVSSSANAQLSPALGFDGTNFLAVWADARNSPGRNDIFGARITPSGTTLDPSGIAISTSAASKSSPAVAFNGTSYLVVWAANRDQIGDQIEAARLSRGGTVPITDRVIGALPSFGSVGPPAVASDGTNFFVVWSEFTDQGAGTQVLHGTLVEPDANVLRDVTLAPVPGERASTAFSPSSGHFLVVWSDFTRAIHGQRVTSAGDPLDGPTGFVIADAANDQVEPWVAFDETNYVVVWSDARDGTRDIYGARVTGAGTVLDPTGVLLSPVGGHDKRFPRVTFDGAHTIVVWLDTGAGDLMASRVTSGLSVLDTPPLDVATGGTLGPPALATDGQGRTLIGDTHFSIDSSLLSQRVRLRFLVNDTTPPDLAVPTSITVNATSPAGAVATYTVTATDNLDPSPTVSCSPPSGSLFPIGSTTVNCTATDAAGNPASASFPVIVKGTAAQLTDLIAFVNSLGLASGLTKSLAAKLEDALKAVNTGKTAAACGKLNDFISAVNAQTGKGITPAQASQLIASAKRIKVVSGCG